MKKLIALFIMAIFCVSFALASSGSIERKCERYCNEYSFPVAVWEEDDDTWREKSNYRDPEWTTHVNGNEEKASWSADPKVECVVYRDDDDWRAADGGTSGRVYSEDDDLEKIAFCALPEEEIPEFSTLGLVGALVAGLTGIMFFRKRN